MKNTQFTPGPIITVILLTTICSLIYYFYSFYTIDGLQENIKRINKEKQAVQLQILEQTARIAEIKTARDETYKILTEQEIDLKTAREEKKSLVKKIVELEGKANSLINEGLELKGTTLITQDKPEQNGGTVLDLNDFTDNNLVIIAGHGRSQDDQWDDNGATYNDGTEREKIKAFIELLSIGNYRVGLDENLSLSEKVKFLKEIDVKYAIEFHFDKRPEGSKKGTKIFYNENIPDSKEFALHICQKMDQNNIVGCRITAGSGLKLIGSFPEGKTVPLIIEIDDPNLVTIEEIAEKLELFNNLINNK